VHGCVVRRDIVLPGTYVNDGKGNVRKIAKKV